MMQQNATKFPWTGQREKAALLVADDDLTDDQIAEAVGVHRATLHRWREHPEFNARVAHHRETVQRAMLRYRIAKKHERLKVLDDMHSKLLTVVVERADAYGQDDDDEAMQAAKKVYGDDVAAGGGTGLVVKQYKQVGRRVVAEYKVDIGLIQQVQSLHEQAAKELGQWVEKKEVGGPGGGPIPLEFTGVSVPLPVPVADDEEAD